MAALLELDALSVDLSIEGRSRRVVDRVSFAIEAGETVGLVGESGAGKSITGRAIARLLPGGAQVSGQISFAGNSVLDLDARGLRRYRATDLGLVFQDPRAAINPVHRIGDFLTEALTANASASRQDAVAEVNDLLRRVGIRDPERRLGQYPHELSGGLLQRVMIASVLAAKPRLVIADEATTALDSTTQAEVLAILSRLQAETGVAMLFITHDLELAAAICARTIVMYAGAVVEEQASASLNSDPLHPYSAALVTSRPGLEAAAGALPVIKGRPLPAWAAPPACPFADRCSFTQTRCEQIRPALEPLDGGRVACLRADELRHNVWPRPEREVTIDG
jgi:oligopeptide/dipeptide ABC transporter ATP-binding protein